MAKGQVSFRHPEGVTALFCHPEEVNNDRSISLLPIFNNGEILRFAQEQQSDISKTLK
jgi:hypothetical protein